MSAIEELAREFGRLPGVGPKTATNLEQAGYGDLDKLTQADPADLAEVEGIGPKTATRLAHHLLRVPDESARALATAVVDVKERLRHC